MGLTQGSARKVAAAAGEYAVGAVLSAVMVAAIGAALGDLCATARSRRRSRVPIGRRSAPTQTIEGRPNLGTRLGRPGLADHLRALAPQVSLVAVSGSLFTHGF